MSSIRKTSVLVVLAVLLASCATVSPTTSTIATADTLDVSPIQEPTETPTSYPTPGDPGSNLASVYGRVIDDSTSNPIPGTAVRLAEVYRSGGEGAFVLDDAYSPATLTDENGNFSIKGVEPKEYVIVVGDVNIAYQIIAESSGDAKVWDLAGGEVMNIGTLEVTLN